MTPRLPRLLGGANSNGNTAFGQLTRGTMPITHGLGTGECDGTLQRATGNGLSSPRTTAHSLRIALHSLAFRSRYPGLTDQPAVYNMHKPYYIICSSFGSYVRGRRGGAGYGRCVGGGGYESSSGRICDSSCAVLRYVASGSKRDCTWLGISCDSCCATENRVGL